MYSIFVNYRRDPHETVVAAIADRLEHYFGDNEVFIDNGIPFGEEYPATIRARVRNCAVLVAVIHKGWADSVKDPPEEDWVRDEIRIALERGIPVIPVLLGDAEMPKRGELPSVIGELAIRQAASVGTSFTADLNQLKSRLESHVHPEETPPAEKPVTKPKRTWLRFLAWLTAAFLLTPILFYTAKTSWEFFAFPAFVSAVAMALVTTCTAVATLSLRRVTDRWNIRTGHRGVRDILASFSPVPGILIVFGSISAINAATRDGRLEDWETLLLATFFVVLVWYVWTFVRRAVARDEAWPPPVTTDHAVYRRAAHRLEHRLTTDREWRRDRTRAVQREAVSIYLDLATARKDLGVRGGVPITRWVRSGYTSETIPCLGWYASIVALDVVAAGVVLFGGPVPGHPLRVVGLTIAIATVFAGAGVFARYLHDRRDTRLWIAEIVKWQHKLGPLIFCPREAPARQDRE
jgi:TIR domain-containing protein